MNAAQIKAAQRLAAAAANVLWKTSLNEASPQYNGPGRVTRLDATIRELAAAKEAWDAASCGVCRNQMPGRRAARAHVEVKTSEYEFSYSHAPRGRGSWAFKIQGQPDLHWYNGTYADAKRDAIRKAREIGAARVTVCP